MKYTSKHAFDTITESGRKQTLKSQTYDYVCRKPMCTQIDVEKDLCASCRKRLSELVKEGLIYEAGIKIINNFKYTTYTVNNSPQMGLMI